MTNASIKHVRKSWLTLYNTEWLSVGEKYLLERTEALTHWWLAGALKSIPQRTLFQNGELPEITGGYKGGKKLQGLLVQHEQNKRNHPPRRWTSEFDKKTKSKKARTGTKRSACKKRKYKDKNLSEYFHQRIHHCFVICMVQTKK